LSTKGLILKKNTVHNYEAILSRFLAKFNDRELSEITPEDILSFLTQLNQTAKQTTKRLRYTLLNTFFNFIKNTLDENLQNPCNSPMLKKLFRNRLMLELMARGGMRVGEVLKIMPRDIEDRKIILHNPKSGQVQQHFVDLSNKGFRVLGVAYRHMGTETVINKNHETGMIFLGFLVLFDPPKSGVADTISRLKTLGVALKIITGDNRLAAANIAGQVGLANPHILTGQEIRLMSTEALLNQVNAIELFAEVEPNQKEKIILALRKAGNVVGFMGDGINDAAALHTADVGISVDDAVDVAKEAADIVLLEKDLGVLINGVREGRVTFSNTLKYVFMATSANFGNMFSMAGASPFLPFLPLLPKQILLTNLITDSPGMTIATDNVDQEMIEKSRRWDLKFIRNFMLTFGIISSVFDYLTFGALRFILRATTEQFRTGWFLESVVSATLIVLVIRTRKPFFKSMPGKALLVATIVVIGVTLIAPLTPFGRIFEFIPMPVSFLLVLIIILVLYILAAEQTKKLFYKRF
jgi:P-type Mg2+ transporter